MPLLLFPSCSEETATDDDYDNWQQRNEQFVASLSDSLKSNPTVWKRFKNFSLDEKKEGIMQDYVYVKKIEQGTETTSPMYTDSVRVSYQGRLIPTKSNPEGFIFDTTVYGNYSMETTSTQKFLVSGLVDGFTTALMHMSRGDHWRVYVPYQLGYKTVAQTNVPAFSTLIFDITLIDFSPAGKAMPVWKTPRR